MCGIIYVKRNDGKPAFKQVLKRYKKQRARGNEGFGFVTLDKDAFITAYKRFQWESETEAELKERHENHVLFHHRYPTSALNIPDTAHPIKVEHAELLFTYYVVHNGIISNDEELKEEHEKLGYTYTTEVKTKYHTMLGNTFIGTTQWNDSEALAIELARTIEGRQGAVRARGSIAYIVLQVSKVSGRVHAVLYGTNGGNPLTITEDKHTGNLCIASEGGKSIPANTCFRLDTRTGEVVELEHVVLEAYELPKIGYGYNAAGYSYSYTKSEKDDEKEYPYNTGYGVSDVMFRTKKDYEGMESEQLESEVEELEELLQVCEGDILEAMSMGDVELEGALCEDKRQLNDQYNIAKNVLERRLLAALTF